MTARKKGWQEVFVTICGLPWAAGMGKEFPMEHTVWEEGGTFLKGCQGRVCSGELQVSPRARGQRDCTWRWLCAGILLTGQLRSSGHSRRPGQWRPSGRRRATVCPRREHHVVTSCLESWALAITKSRLPFIGFILVVKFSAALLAGTGQTTAPDSLGGVPLAWGGRRCVKLSWVRGTLRAVGDEIWGGGG